MAIVKRTFSSDEEVIAFMQGLYFKREDVTIIGMESAGWSVQSPEEETITVVIEDRSVVDVDEESNEG